MLGRISSVVAACALTACTVQGPTLNAQAEQMEFALLECKAQLGLPGQTQTQVTFDGGVPVARVVPFDLITAQDAARINACADNSVALNDGQKVVPMSDAASVTPAPVPVDYNSGACPRGRSGLYGGTSYCFAVSN
ncbi:MAG: hypothetical protein KC448_03080 [Yoonia sp.]|nr:hypothetical protein [Yoonia sp.]